MRDHLVLYINGQRHAVHGRDAFLSLSEYLRRRCGLIGTKIVCSEGDCGACTVLIGRAQNPPPSKGWEQPSTVASGDRAQGGSPREAMRGGIDELTDANGKASSESTAHCTPPTAHSLRYLPIDSCIQFLFQLDGAHVITVEGLGRSGQLTPVQQAMIDCHGSQCGFCTPGFVVSMTGLLEEAPELDEESLRTGLTGNLCRCTGYTQIIESGLRCNDAEHERLNDLYPPEPMLTDFHELRKSPITLHSQPPSEPRGLSLRSDESHIAYCPTTLNDALAFLAEHSTATIVAGATDLGVRINKTGRLPAAILDLNRLEELAHVRIEDNTLIAGARATWTDVLSLIPPAPSPRWGWDQTSTVAGGDRAQCGSPCEALGRGEEVGTESGDLSVSSTLQEFAYILSVFGAPQIRHVGTIAGNIANASPIADSLPFFYVMEARLALASRGATRELDINNFYKGYKQLNLAPGELITEVRIPLPTDADLLRLYKVSRRRDLDISSLTTAIRLRLSDPPPSKGGARGGIAIGDDEPLITHAAIALGGVGPTVIRPRRAEQFLLGQPFTEQTMQAAATIAVEEITPITDVRGAADYRRQLVKNIFRKFYYQYQAEVASA